MNATATIFRLQRNFPAWNFRHDPNNPRFERGAESRPFIASKSRSDGSQTEIHSSTAVDLEIWVTIADAGDT